MHILFTKLLSLQGDPEIASVVADKLSGTRDWDGIFIAELPAPARPGPGSVLFKRM